MGFPTVLRSGGLEKSDPVGSGHAIDMGREKTMVRIEQIDDGLEHVARLGIDEQVSLVIDGVDHGTDVVSEIDIHLGSLCFPVGGDEYEMFPLRDISSPRTDGPAFRFDCAGRSVAIIAKV